MQVLDYLQIDKPDPVKQTVEYRSAAKRNEDMPRKLLDRFPAFDHSPRPVGGKRAAGETASCSRFFAIKLFFHPYLGGLSSIYFVKNIM